MAPRGPRPVLLLPLALLAACLALAAGQPWVEPNFTFTRKHVDNPKTKAPNDDLYCKEMMLSRGLYGKAVNTFIHEAIKKINEVCSAGGTQKIGGLYESKDPFKVTQCISKPKTFSLSYTGKAKTTKIIVGCWNSYPVYFLEQI